MKVLVTGGSGFIGSNLVNKLIKEKHEVIVLDDLSTGNKDFEIKGATYVYEDIEFIEVINGEKIDICYHLAAISRVQPSFDDPSETFRVNAYGTQMVAEWARINDVKLVYAGSSSKWTDPTSSPYAITKSIGEDILKSYRKSYKCNFEICRFYNVYGPNELVDGKWANVIGIWRYQIDNNIPITIVGDGDQRRDFTHVDDIVDALYKIGTQDKKHEDAWELGAGINYSINELFDMMDKKFGPIIKTHIPDQLGNYRSTLRENNDTLDILGWEPKDRLNDYIQSL